MTRAEYKAQSSEQRKQAKAGNLVQRTLERNLRRDYRCLAFPALRKLAKCVRREVDSVLTAQHNAEDALMAM